MSDNSSIWDDDFGPCPAGEYVVVVEKVTFKTSMKGQDYLAVTFEVTTGPHEGRRIFINFYIGSENQRFRERNQARLDEVVRACGVQPNKDYSGLWSAGCVITVDLQPARGSYGPSNQLRGVRPVDKPNGNAKPGGSLPPPLPDDKIPF